MKLSLSIEDLECLLEVIETPNYIPQSVTRPHPSDLQAMARGELGYFSVMVETTQRGQTLNHYFPGILLSTDKEERIKDLEDFLDDGGALDHILKHWELNE